MNQLSARDLPRVLEALEAIPDTARRAFESDELLGGSLAERYRLVLALPDDVRQRAEEVQVLTRAQAVEFAVAASEAQAMGRELRNLGSQATSALIPVLEEVLGVLTPIVRTAGALIEANPLLVQGALALGGVLAALTTALWAYNAAQAARLALSGPHGWAILAGAAGLLAAGGIAYAVGRNNLQQSEAAAEAERRFDERFGTQQSQMVQTATQAGSRPACAKALTMPHPTPATAGCQPSCLPRQRRRRLTPAAPRQARRRRLLGRCIRGQYLNSCRLRQVRCSKICCGGRARGWKAPAATCPANCAACSRALNGTNRNWAATSTPTA